MSIMKKILIVEDNREIAELERDYLEASDFEVVIEEDGSKGQVAALSGRFDLVILDLMLPHIDGFNLCRRIRTKLDIPVIIVSARQTDIDKIRGFGLGADDYMTKPFSPGELVARVKAHLSRYAQLKGEGGAVVKRLACKDLVLEPDSRRVFCQQREIHLTNREFEILQFFRSCSSSWKTGVLSFLENGSLNGFGGSMHWETVPRWPFISTGSGRRSKRIRRIRTTSRP